MLSLLIAAGHGAEPGADNLLPVLHEFLNWLELVMAAPIFHHFHHYLSISVHLQDKAQGMGKFVHAAGDWSLAVEYPHYV